MNLQPGAEFLLLKSSAKAEKNGKGNVMENFLTVSFHVEIFLLCTFIK